MAFPLLFICNLPYKFSVIKNNIYAILSKKNYNFFILNSKKVVG